MAAALKDVTQRFHLLRNKGESWKIRDARTDTVHVRPLYTSAELQDLALWLNERERGYPVHPALHADLLRG